MELEDTVEEEEEADYELDIARKAVDQAEIESAVEGIENMLDLGVVDNKLGRHAVTKVRPCWFPPVNTILM